MSSYRKEFSFEQRKNDSISILKKYPDKIPIICEKDYMDLKSPDILRRKYLVSPDLTVGQFLFTIRKKVKIGHETAMYLCINNFIPSGNALVGNLYDIHKNDDGHLYVVYMLENTFG